MKFRFAFGFICGLLLCFAVGAGPQMTWWNWRSSVDRQLQENREQIRRVRADSAPAFGGSTKAEFEQYRKNYGIPKAEGLPRTHSGN